MTDSRIETINGCMTAFLSGELDHHAAKAVRENIDSKINTDRPHTLILDFLDITFMDSSGIGLVMGRYRQMKLLDGELHITNTSPNISRVMRLAGLEKIAHMDQIQEKNKTRARNQVHIRKQSDIQKKKEGIIKNEK